MPEQRGLYPRMRVGEQLAYFAQHHGLSGRDARARTAVWLERFGLADRAKSKLEDLSHGNQQRIQLATALVHDPELLVLDEPFSGLDPIGVATMTEVLRERAAAGVGVVFSSHQLDLVEEVCEDVVIVSRGRVVADGEIDALKAASGRRHLEVEVAGSGGAWLDGHERVLRHRARRRLGEAARRRARGPRRRSSRRPARRARCGGSRSSRPSCRSCSWRPSTAPQPSAEDAGPMSRLRAIRLVAMREILERGRSRGYVLSLVFTVFLLVAGFLLPAFLLGQDESPNLALVGTPPAGLEAAIAGRGRRSTTSPSTSAPSRTGPPPRRRVRAKTIDAALDVPADLSGPGELIVLEEADEPDPGDHERRGHRRCAPAPTRRCWSRRPSTPLEPPTEEHTTAVIFANAGIILMFIGIFTYGTWVLTGVVEEKQSRVVEVVLTTVRPRDLLMGKVLGIGLLALVQLARPRRRRDRRRAAQRPPRRCPPTTAGAVVQLLTWFILGFAFYSTAMGFLGLARVARRGGVERVAAGHDDRDACRTWSRSCWSRRSRTASSRTVLTFFPPSAPMVVPLRAALGAIPAVAGRRLDRCSCWSRSGPCSWSAAASTRARSSRPAAG